MAVQPKNPGAKLGNGPRRVKEKPADIPTLADAGIDKNLADRARRAHDMPKKEFEAMIATGRDDVRKASTSRSN
jgi:hypothetical protein